MLNYSISEINIDQMRNIRILRVDSDDNNFRCRLIPQDDIDSQITLVVNGDDVDQGFLDYLENTLKPILSLLWTPEVIQARIDSETIPDL